MTNWGLPEQASTYAADIDFGISIIHWAMVLIFVLWGTFFIYLLVKYRQRPGVVAQYKEPSHLWSLVPDVVIVVFEIGLLAFYAIPGWNAIMRASPSEAESNVVTVVAEQFAWNVQYPGPDGKFGRRGAPFIDSDNVLGLDPDDEDGYDDIVTLNQMHVPLGKPTLVYLYSKDVIHSFFVPAFRTKLDAVPGMKTSLWFEPTKLGKFEIGCAQLCGIGHATMRGDVIVHTPEDFEAWLKTAAEEAAEYEDEDEA